MKKLSSLWFAPVLFLLAFCQSNPGKIGDFRLLPMPQRFEILGVSHLEYRDLESYHVSPGIEPPIPSDLLKGIEAADLESNAQITFTMDGSLDVPSEGYTIEITENRIHLTGRDRAGLFYALKTLEQLLEDAKEQNVNLPKCRIRDFPHLPYRAVHIDVKHHLEKREYYFRLIDKLASYKVNAVIVEMEDKLRYSRRPVVASPDAFSIEEWREISEYAQGRNIEISPLIQGLGHASFILKHEKYRDLRDDPESDWAFNPLDPRTYELQFDLYRDAMEATPHGRFLHVGGDEVQTTGRGSGQSALELQLIWLNKVCAFAAEHGRIPIFWDDMVLKHAGLYRSVYDRDLDQQQVDELWDKNEHMLLQHLDRFPKNCIFMRWNYSVPEAIGNRKAMDWFRRQGLQVMGATAGQTRWFLMPQRQSNMESIKTFALISIKSGLDGLLLTLWDDDSPHFELYSRGILAFAEHTWTGNKRSKEELKAAYRTREFSSLLAADEYAFIDRLEEPVAFHKNALIQGNRRNDLKRSKNPLDDVIIDLPDRDSKGAWSENHAQRLEQAAAVSERCKDIAASIRELQSKAIRNGYALEVYAQVNELVSFTAGMLLALRSYDTSEAGPQEEEALAALRRLPEEFRQLRGEFERVYSQTRILNKPRGYILDQDHHAHLANQTVSFDWQFLAELLFLEKLSSF